MRVQDDTHTSSITENLTCCSKTMLTNEKNNLKLNLQNSTVTHKLRHINTHTHVLTHTITLSFSLSTTFNSLWKRQVQTLIEPEPDLAPALSVRPAVLFNPLRSMSSQPGSQQAGSQSTRLHPAGRGAYGFSPAPDTAALHWAHWADHSGASHSAKANHCTTDAGCAAGRTAREGTPKSGPPPIFLDKTTIPPFFLHPSARLHLY